MTHGAQLGWFVAPDERSVLAFLPNCQPIQLAGEDRLPVPEFIELNLTVAQVFAWLKAGR